MGRFFAVIWGLGRGGWPSVVNELVVMGGGLRFSEGIRTGITATPAVCFYVPPPCPVFVVSVGVDGEIRALVDDFFRTVDGPDPGEEPPAGPGWQQPPTTENPRVNPAFFSTFPRGSPAQKGTTIGNGQRSRRGSVSPQMTTISHKSPAAQPPGAAIFWPSLEKNHVPTTKNHKIPYFRQNDGFLVRFIKRYVDPCVFTTPDQPTHLLISTTEPQEANSGSVIQKSPGVLREYIPIAEPLKSVLSLVVDRNTAEPIWVPSGAIIQKPVAVIQHSAFVLSNA